MLFSSFTIFLFSKNKDYSVLLLIYLHKFEINIFLIQKYIEKDKIVFFEENNLQFISKGKRKRE